MIELLVLLVMIALLLAAPLIITFVFIAIIAVTLRALPYVGWIVLALIAVTVIAGCAKPAPVFTVQASPFPSQLLDCKPEPMPPATGTQRQVATYVLDLADAGDDCRQKLGAVKAIEASRHAP